MKGISNIQVKSMVKILTVMFLLTAVLLFLLALLIWKIVPEKQGIGIGIAAVYVITCTAGGFLAGKVQKVQKYLWGLLIGILYGLLILMLSMAAFADAGRTLWEIVLNLMLCALGGMLGGMAA